MTGASAFTSKVRLAQILLPFGLSKLRRALSFSRLVRWRFSGLVASELVIAPQDITTADATLANDIYSGYFAFGGHVISSGGQSPFEMKQAPLSWQRELHEFSWLRHLRAADTSVARAQARAFVEDWLRFNQQSKSIAWDIECTANRLIAWLCHSPLLLEDCDHIFYKRFLSELSRKVRFLRLVASDAPPGMPRLLVAIALSYAAVSMKGHDSFMRNATRRLEREIDQQILPDGGHISRNPAAVIELLVLLMPLRQAMIARDFVPGEKLLGAIDRMVPMLRFFRLGDGTFAKFNGMGDTRLDLVGSMLTYDDAQGAPVLNAFHSGYQRIVADDVVLLMDTGGLPPAAMSGRMHAGCLSFELSAGRERIVINCGSVEAEEGATQNLELSQIVRSTAAHSTLTINEKSSCEFAHKGWFRGKNGAPILAGPDMPVVSRAADSQKIDVNAIHDGFVSRFGLKHQRALSFSQDGVVLNGQDVLLGRNNELVSRNNKHVFHIRFHIHPSVDVVLSSLRTVEITLKSGGKWLFHSQKVDVAVEESVTFSELYGVTTTKQIVLTGLVGENSVVDWSFQKLP